MPRTIDTVLFDIGNTLLDFDSLDPRPFFAAGFRLGHAYLTSLGHTLPPPDGYARRVGRVIFWRFLWSRVVRREMELFETMIRFHKALGIDLDRGEAEELAWQMCLPMRRVGRADPQARTTLGALRARGYKLGVISNTSTPPPALDRHLAEEGLLEFFGVRVYSCTVGYMKPHRRIFDLALKRIGSTPEKTAYVGDKINIDVKGAARLGLLTVLKSPNGTPQLSRWRPDHVIRGLGELPAVLEAYASPCR